VKTLIIKRVCVPIYHV